jgi:O-antigen/teichoic acid export membrane protein
VASEYRTIGKHALIYGSGVVLGKLAGFVMLPVYTRYLTPADYGVLELLSMTIDVIGMIAGVGLGAGVFKYYSQLQDPAERRTLLSTVALAGAGLAGTTALLGILLSGPLAGLVFKGGGNPDYFRAYFLIYFLQSVAAPAWLLMRIQQRSVLFVAVNFVKLVLALALNIYFVVVRRMGMEGVILSNALVAGVAALFLTTYTFRHAGFAFSRATFQLLARSAGRSFSGRWGASC